MRSCGPGEFAEILLKYDCEDLTPDERESLRTHLAGCSPCHRRLVHLVKVETLLRSDPSLSGSWDPSAEDLFDFTRVYGSLPLEAERRGAVEVHLRACRRCQGEIARLLLSQISSGWVRDLLTEERQRPFRGSSLIPLHVLPDPGARPLRNLEKAGKVALAAAACLVAALLLQSNSPPVPDTGWRGGFVYPPQSWGLAHFPSVDPGFVWDTPGEEVSAEISSESGEVLWETRTSDGFAFPDPRVRRFADGEWYVFQLTVRPGAPDEGSHRIRFQIHERATVIREELHALRAIPCSPAERAEREASILLSFGLEAEVPFSFLHAWVLRGDPELLKKAEEAARAAGIRWNPQIRDLLGRAAASR